MEKVLELDAWIEKTTDGNKFETDGGSKNIYVDKQNR